VYLFKLQSGLQRKVCNVVASVVEFGKGLTLIQKRMEDRLVHSLVHSRADGLDVHRIV